LIATYLGFTRACGPCASATAVDPKRHIAIPNADRAEISKMPDCSIALHAFESADIIARCGRFDLGQPHGIAALGARQDSDFGTAVEWIWMGGWHDVPLDQAGAQYSQSPVTADRGR